MEKTATDESIAPWLRERISGWKEGLESIFKAPEKPNLPGFRIRSGETEVEFWSSETTRVSNYFNMAMDLLKIKK